MCPECVNRCLEETAAHNAAVDESLVGGRPMLDGNGYFVGHMGLPSTWDVPCPHEEDAV